MDGHHQNQGFKLPESFLTQLEEYTRGYMLIVCNDVGDVYTHEAYDNAVIKLGLMNYADIHVSAALTHMKNTALKEEEDLDEQLDMFEERENLDDDDENDENEF